MNAQSGQDRFDPVWPDGVWPNANQELLIKACLLDDAGAARVAFRDWSDRRKREKEVEMQVNSAFE